MDKDAISLLKNLLLEAEKLNNIEKLQGATARPKCSVCLENGQLTLNIPRNKKFWPVNDIDKELLENPAAVLEKIKNQIDEKSEETK